MKGIGVLIGSFYIIGGFIALVLFVYVLRNRLKEKKTEDFEKRDN